MTPDESEIWVADPVNNAWQVWDNPGDGRNPVYNPSKMIKPTAGVVHSWVAMTNDGKLAFLGDSSVIDVKTHKEIAVMKDEFGRRDRPHRKAPLHDLPGWEADRDKQPVRGGQREGVRRAHRRH